MPYTIIVQLKVQIWLTTLLKIVLNPSQRAQNLRKTSQQNILTILEDQLTPVNQVRLV